MTLKTSWFLVDGLNAYGVGVARATVVSHTSVSNERNDCRSRHIRVGSVIRFRRRLPG